MWRRCFPHSLQVHITLLDRNDSPPEFGDSLFQYDVEEGVPVDHEVATLLAEDKDLSGTTTYSIVEGSAGKFRVDAETG